MVAETPPRRSASTFHWAFWACSDCSDSLTAICIFLTPSSYEVLTDNADPLLIELASRLNATKLQHLLGVAQASV